MCVSSFTIICLRYISYTVFKNYDHQLQYVCMEVALSLMVFDFSRFLDSPQKNPRTQALFGQCRPFSDIFSWCMACFQQYPLVFGCIISFVSTHPTIIGLVTLVRFSMLISFVSPKIWPTWPEFQRQYHSSPRRQENAQGQWSIGKYKRYGINALKFMIQLFQKKLPAMYLSFQSFNIYSRQTQCVP